MPQREQSTQENAVRCPGSYIDLVDVAGHPQCPAISTAAPQLGGDAIGIGQPRELKLRRFRAEKASVQLHHVAITNRSANLRHSSHRRMVTLPSPNLAVATSARTE